MCYVLCNDTPLQFCIGQGTSSKLKSNFCNLSWKGGLWWWYRQKWVSKGGGRWCTQLWSQIPTRSCNNWITSCKYQINRIMQKWRLGDTISSLYTRNIFEWIPFQFNISVPILFFFNFTTIWNIWKMYFHCSRIKNHSSDVHLKKKSYFSPTLLLC